MYWYLPWRLAILYSISDYTLGFASFMILDLVPTPVNLPRLHFHCILSTGLISRLHLLYLFSRLFTLVCRCHRIDGSAANRC